MLIQLAGLFGKIFLLMGLGIGLSKKGIMTANMKEQLSAFLLKAVLPINIISSAGHSLSGDSSIGMLHIFIISVSYYIFSIALFVVLTRRYKNRQDFRSVFINSAVFANVGFIGFPILGEFFGSTGTLYTVAYNIGYQLFFYSFGLFLLDGNGKLSFKSLLGNSRIYISIVSILLYLSGIRFPEFIQSALTAVGGMMSPLSMIIIGWEIAEMDLSTIMRDKYSYMISAYRLAFAPVMLAAVLHLLGMSGTVAAASVLLTALPCGSLTVIMSQEKGVDSAFAARAVAQTTVLMLITLPLIFMLTGMWF